MRKITVLLLVMLAIMPVSIFVYAQTGEQIPFTGMGALKAGQDTALFKSSFLDTVNADEQGYYSDSPANKGGIGVINATTFFMDVPAKMAEVNEKDGAFNAWTIGLGQGVAEAFMRGSSGVYDIATCVIPPYDEAKMEPAYQVQKPSNGFKIDLIKW